ncbi:hypothetical protein PLIIFM63780_002123 [Purpureocillium lilacinum]|nr:hypothetical protein PLIIFM63780_002123 [Purpureocillium lilacinum]
MKRFAIHSTAANFDDSPQLKETYLTFLEVAQNFKIDGPIAEDFYDWAIEPLLPMFKSIPPTEEGHWFLDDSFREQPDKNNLFSIWRHLGSGDLLAVAML